jgi:phage regulator Rha-like protein
MTRFEELKESLEDELQQKGKAIKARRTLEEELDELKEQLDDEHVKLNDLDDRKHKKEIEVERS